VAGDDLPSVATTVAHALECPVAIAIPALGEPVIRPEGSLSGAHAAAIAAHAAAIAAGHAGAVPAPIVEAVTARIGEQIVGIVAAATSVAPASRREPAPERRAWLEAAATAASVTALITEAHVAGTQGTGEVLLAELAAGPVEDLPVSSSALGGWAWTSPRARARSAHAPPDHRTAAAPGWTPAMTSAG